ncbi:hypothetical protein C461_09976 [Halorubrum aidingense JCM 13560]|uniref:Uncharacterized protein n=1 Tax=Halorubrum aidingense JCM 13560 TaxID=1230454 RepID=M0PDA3_9EURY|nr:DUF5813 family protein [Halorubrum aidingense]EMA66830.1 hypothetical protein C461_09976 [Halorubrum aidingense JCM 13560]
MTDSESERGSEHELPDRVRRAFADHGSFEPAADGVWTAETTPFDGDVRAEPAADGRVRFLVTVRVPTLSAVTTDEVADVVEEGWTETFELRVVDVGGVTRKEREFDPTVTIDGDEIRVGFELTDINERRGVDDAGALINFVEGTYVQGVIPGYEYTEPVTDLLSAARRQANGGAF